VSGTDAPKYMNTPETSLYKKSNVLYGFDRASEGFRKRGRMLVVEGNFDVLSLHQAGFTEAVATCGTALTVSHLEKVRRKSVRDVILVMDADNAGLKAAEEALPKFVELGIQPWRITLPEGFKDPDEVVRSEGGAERFEDAIAHKEPLFEWVVQRKLDAAGHSAMGRERALDVVLPMLARLRDPTLNSRVSRRLGMPEEIVLERIRGYVPPRERAPEPELAAEPRPERIRLTSDQTHLLWLVVHRYDEVADLLGRIGIHNLEREPRLRTVLGRLLKGEPVAGLLRDLEWDPEVSRIVSAVVARDKLYEPSAAASGALQVAARLLRPQWTQQLARAKDAYEAAARGGDVASSLALVRSLKALQDREKSLERALRAGEVDRAIDLLAGDGHG
jgi:DNA primase